MIELHDVTKRYGRATVVDRVSFTVRPGTVTGFLGPNGAGKSTTLRVLCGLARADAGAATILGRSYRDLADPGRQVGVMLDATAQHRGRTGHETLALTALALGLSPRRVDEALETVGLTPAEARRRVGRYSLGMRQRIGLAHALLAEPEVLVLDEPANGLDPAGVRWMRDLLRSHADRGGTVLLSSHLLLEVQEIADEVVVIGAGSVVAAGPVASLTSSRGGAVAASPSAADLALALGRAGVRCESTGPDLLWCAAEPRRVGEIACAASLVLSRLEPAVDTDLESAYLRLTSPHARRSTAAGTSTTAATAPDLQESTR